MKQICAIILLGSSVTTAAIAPLNAQSLQPVRPGVNTIGQADLQALRNQLQRQQFQQQQQIYREIDRQVVVPPQTVAPAIRQPCQSSSNGGTAVGGCR